MAAILRVVLTAILLFCHLAKSEDCDEFTTQPQDVVARAGTMELMDCEYTSSEGDSLPVQWLKGTTSVLDGDAPCDCQVTDGGSLVFNNVSATDSGEYDCFIFVTHGVTKTCSATLRLAASPGVTNKMGPGSIELTYREFSVHLTGDPVPVVKWLHGNSVLSNSTRISISSHEQGNGRIERLTISGIQPEDRGLYTLHASNTGGDVTVEWIVLVVFGNVRIAETEDEDGTLLTCTGEFYSEGPTTPQVLWIRGEDEVAATGQDTQTMNMYDTTFVTSLHVPLSSCRGTSEVVKCQLNHFNVEMAPQKTLKSVIVCEEGVCIPPQVEATVDGCSDLRVTLTGSLGHYVIEYQPEDTSVVTRKNVTMTVSPQSFSDDDLMEGTTYDVRVTCPDSGSTSPFVSVITNSKPDPVTGVEVTDFSTNSGTFSRLTWMSSSTPDVTGYHIMWTSGNTSGNVDQSETTTHFEHAIMCDVEYEYQVAAINLCHRGPFSAPVEAMCETVPPPQRVELHQLSYRTGDSHDSLFLTFTIAYLELVKSVYVDVVEQNDNFVTLRTVNYTISEDVYKGGSVCVAGLTPNRQYQVCLRVVYSDIGNDSTCSRLVTETEEVEDGGESCQLPTYITDPSDTSESPVPDWGIAVIVVAALLLVALLFCFLGLCFACQTSQSKNVNFGSSSSIDTERGGNVVPTNLHMHNPRTMSPTRSCLKYHRDRGHSTTWNDHVDTLRQMETSKGTHV